MKRIKMDKFEKIKNLKEKDIIKIKGKKYEVVALGWEGEYNSKKEGIKNYRSYTLYECENKSILPNFSITIRDDLNKIFDGKKEIDMKDIEIP